MPIKFLILLMTTSYHAIATWIEDSKYKPPGQLIDIGGYKLHLYSQGEGNVTVVIDHSLGGLDGYFLIERFARSQKCEVRSQKFLTFYFLVRAVGLRPHSLIIFSGIFLVGAYNPQLKKYFLLPPSDFLK